MQGAIVGREAELQRLAAQWARGARRVTIWGPAGVGKTCLARAGLARWQGRAWWCDLTRAHDLEALCAAVAGALGLAQSRPGSVEQIGRALADQGPGLLVLDGFEQLADCAAVLTTWARCAPELSQLVTSRQRLRLPGEVSHELAPLALPRPGDDALQSAAVQLFVACAQASDAAFTLDDRSAGRVAELVTRLEGNPLAIVLATSHLEVMGLEGLLARVPTSLEVPGAPRREGGPGTSSFRAALARSWGRLTEVERRTLARCAVFVGSFTLADAEALVDEEDVLGVLSSLRDKSMLQSAATDGTARLSMFESVRGLAREELARSGELAPLQRRHADEFVRRADNATAVDRDNSLAALAFLLSLPPDPGHPGEVLRLLLAVDPLLARQGPHGLHAQLLDQVLAACAPDTSPPAMLAQAHAARARLRRSQGDPRGARADLDVALDLARSAGEPRLLAQMQIERGVLDHHHRALDAAEQHYQDALRTLAAHPTDALQARALGNLGALLHDARKPDQARAAYGRAISLFRRHADPRLEGIFLANLALLEQESGQLAAAHDALERAAALLQEAGDARLLGITLANHGALRHEQGDPGAARELLRQALGLLRQVGDPRSEALALARLGAAEASLGLTRAASERLDQAQALLEHAGDPTALHGLPVYRAFVLLAQAQASPDDGVSLTRAQALLRAVQEPTHAGASASDLLDDVRTALRIARPWAERLLSRRASPAHLPDDALVVSAEGDWFRAPHGSPQSLRLRRPLRAMLALLVTRRLDGQGADLGELQAVAWPGEKMSPTAATNRVRVALAELRKRGLQTCLVRQGNRYALATSVPLVVTPSPPSTLL